MLRRNQIIFFTIIGLALVVTLGILAMERLGIYTLPSRAVERIAIEISVPAALATWADQEADEFNARNNDADVSIVALNGLTALDQYDGASRDSLPHGWIPDASFVAAIAQEEALPFEMVNESIATTELMWGGYSDRIQVIQNLNWQSIHDAAAAGTWSQMGGDNQWGNFKLTIASPAQSAEGLAALISAAASYYKTDTLTSQQLTDPEFMAWLLETVESVPNFSTLGPDPAESMASRGPSVGDIGFLSEAAWMNSASGLERWGGFVTEAARYPVSLDYPFLVRTNADMAEQSLAERFAQYLAGEVNDLGSGYDDGSGTPLGKQIDGKTALSLLRWAERERLGQ